MASPTKSSPKPKQRLADKSASSESAATDVAVPPTTAKTPHGPRARKQRLIVVVSLVIIASLATGGWLLLRSHSPAPKANPASIKTAPRSTTTPKPQSTPLEAKLAAPEQQVLRTIPYTFYLPSDKTIDGHHIAGTGLSLYYDETHPARTQLVYYLKDSLDTFYRSMLVVYPRTSSFNPPADCSLPGGSPSPLACTKYPRSTADLPAYLTREAHFLDSGVSDHINAFTLYAATDTMIIRIEIDGAKNDLDRNIDVAYHLARSMKKVPARDLPAETAAVFRPSTLDDGAWTAGNTARPTIVGQCAATRVSAAGTAGKFILYANGLTQADYEAVEGIQNSQVADPIRLCLTQLEPPNCPPGDRRGKVYSAANLRTGAQWMLPGDLHLCGGA